MSSNERTMNDRIREILNYLDDELHPVVSQDHWEVYSHLHDMITSLQPKFPEYYDYSDIDDVWELYAEGQDVNLTCLAKQLKDAMWLGYRKGKQDAQSEAIAEPKIYGNKHNCVLTMFGECSYDRTGCGSCEVVDKIREAISSEPKTGWIPCSEKLPKKQEKSYWVCTDSGYQCECRWTNINHIWTHLTTDWHWHFADIPQYAEVVAWMPLPKPYKEEEE